MLGYVANKFWAARLSRAESEKWELQGDSTTHSELGAETMCETQHPKAIWETASPWAVTAVRASAVLFEPRLGSTSDRRAAYHHFDASYSALRHFSSSNSSHIVLLLMHVPQQNAGPCSTHLRVTVHTPCDSMYTSRAAQLGSMPFLPPRMHEYT